MRGDPLAPYDSSGGFPFALPARDPSLSSRNPNSPAQTADAGAAGAPAGPSAADAGPGRRGEALERERRVAGALLGVAQEVASLTDPAMVAPTLARAVVGLTGAHYAVVGAWVDEDAFDVRAFHGLAERQISAVLAMPLTTETFGLLRQVRSGRPVMIEQPYDPSLYPTELFEDLGLDVIVVGPIVVEDRPWGFVGVGATAADPFIRSTAEELIGGLASIGATAIARAEAVAELAAQREQLAASVAERTHQLRTAVDELRRASQAKTDFLANVSHELRTPLTAILGFAEILANGLDGKLNPRQRDDVATIQASGRRLLELIDDLIDISKIEAGRMDLRTGPLELNATAASVVDEFRALAGQKGIGLTVVPAGEPVNVSADPGRLHEILLNLLSNAVKFTPPAGKVRVVVTLEPAGAAGGSPMARLDVSDTGIGIAPENQERIFEKFQRMAGPEHPGTGLGLAIARELAELHDGSLTVESTLGLGSRFSLRLPTVPGSA